MSNVSSKVSSVNSVYPKIDTNFNFKYVIKDQSSLLKTLNKINENDWTQNIQLFNTSPNEYLLSLRAYPFDVSLYTNVGTKTNVMDIANTNLTITGADLYPMKDYNFYTFGTIRVGYFDFDRNNSEYFYNNFLDYNILFTVWLPYIDFVELPIEKLLNKRVTFDYAIDFDTGECCCYVNVSDLYTFDNMYTLSMFKGIIGSSIPFSATNYNEMIRNVGLQGIQGLTGLGMMLAGSTNPILLTGGILTTLNSVTNMMTNQHHIKSTTSSDNRNSLVNPQNIYFIFSRPKPINVLDYAKYKGKPCLKTLLLSDLSGYTVVDNIHLEGFTSTTEEELVEIEQLLKSGVIL